MSRISTHKKKQDIRRITGKGVLRPVSSCGCCSWWWVGSWWWLRGRLGGTPWLARLGTRSSGFLTHKSVGFVCGFWTVWFASLRAYNYLVIPFPAKFLPLIFEFFHVTCIGSICARAGGVGRRYRLPLPNQVINNLPTSFDLKNKWPKERERERAIDTIDSEVIVPPKMTFVDWENFRFGFGLTFSRRFCRGSSEYENVPSIQK